MVAQRWKKKTKKQFMFANYGDTLNRSFLGQQNDYILLSLVRTKTVGHIRDVRRLIVAMSRARLGLYIFGRIGEFQLLYIVFPKDPLLEMIF